ncbi:hypothetical protein GWK16_23875 [Roseomonas sp. JC162]|uniref:Uncharacterized protein n=1 Tax=Neoroseomonas marina TaxID=1232220 RepID=A0A848ELS0_9PROT|nr:hypothetical protein [Neoroseomonas marina]NMJ44307.1 hypothetical protein [Neoroseomonas marina]
MTAYKLKWRPPGAVAARFVAHRPPVDPAAIPLDILRGPIAGGKSVASMVRVFTHMMEQTPGPNGWRHTRWAVIRNTNPQLEMTTIKTWLEWFPEEHFGKLRWAKPFKHDFVFPPARVKSEVWFVPLDDLAQVRNLLSLELNTQRADALSMAEPHLEPFVPHVWVKDRVREGREKLIGIVGDFWHAQAGHTWADAAIRAEVAVSHLMGEAVHETLERVLFRHLRLGGLAPDLSADRAKALAQPVVEAMRRRSPGRVAKEIASAFGARLDPVDKAGIPQLVRDALAQAGVRGQVPQSPSQSTALGLAPGALPPPKPGAPDALDRLIGEIVDVSKSAQGDRWADFNRPGHARQRTIDVPTERIAEFLDLSQRTGGLQYARRIGASIEMSRQFGDPSMLGELSRRRADACATAAKCMVISCLGVRCAGHADARKPARDGACAG